MAISQAALQQALLSLLCFDDESAPVLALRIDPKLFSGRVYRLLATTAVAYIQEYSLAPKLQLEFLLESEFKRGEEGKFLGQTVDLLKQQVTEIDPKFVLNELDIFLESQRITLAASEAIEAVARGDLDQARELLAISDTKNLAAKFSDNQILVSDPTAMLKFLDVPETDFISSGIQAIDELGARPERKTLTLFIAPTGKGKTWFLTNVAKAALQYKRTCLIVTLELSAEKYAARLLQSMFGLTKAEVQTIRTPYFIKDALNNFTVQFRELQRESLFTQRRALRERLDALIFYPKILIKEFPTDSLTVNELSLYLDYLKKQENFEPDVLVLDYAQLMQLNVVDFRLNIGRLFKQLRGLAAKRNLALITCAQGNKNSDTAKTVDRGDVAEDWSQIGTADLVYTYSQTPQEYKLGLSRVLIAKARDVVDRIMILNAQSYTIGQFSLDSVIMQRDVVQEIEKLTGIPDA